MTMTTVQIPTRRLIFASAVAMVLALAPMIAGPTVAPHAIAQGECTGSDTPDDYTLQCAPAAVPDFNDQLSEAEVAEPGFNGHRAVAAGAVLVEGVDIVEQLPHVRQPLDEGAIMLPLARLRARGNGSDRRRRTGRCGAFRGRRDRSRPSRHLQPQFHRRARPPNCRASCQASRSTRRTTYPPTPT